MQSNLPFCFSSQVGHHDCIYKAYKGIMFDRKPVSPVSENKRKSLLQLLEFKNSSKNIQLHSFAVNCESELQYSRIQPVSDLLSDLYFPCL